MPKQPTYVYTDENGEPALGVSKLPNGSYAIYHKKPDGWHAGKNGAKDYPYNLPEVIEAARSHKKICVDEGEKDCESARQRGLVATTNIAGAGAWTREHAAYLKGARYVYIIFDRDAAGRERANKVADTLDELGIKYGFYCTPVKREGADLTDHFNAGFVFEELLRVKRPGRAKPKVKAKFTVDAIEHPPAVFRVLYDVLEKARWEGTDGKQFNAVCPAHDDNRPSLSVSWGSKKDDVAVMLKCQRNPPCEYDEIVAALEDQYDIEPKELSVRWKPTRVELEGETTEVQNEFRKIETRARANELFRAAQTLSIRHDLGTVTNWASLKEIPRTPVRFAIDDLAQAGANVLLAAEAKTGKTRLALNLCRALCDGEPFLGSFAINAPSDARCLYLNYEMNDDPFLDWAEQTNIKRADRLEVMNLKGRLLPFWEPEYKEALAAWLRARGVWMMILDTYMAASAEYVTDENTSLDQYRFQAHIDQLKEMAGVSVVVVLDHMGKQDKEHARGSSRKEDWPDAIWRLSRGENASTDREIKVEGRSVPSYAYSLMYDDGTTVYSHLGLTAKERAAEKRVVGLLSVIVHFEKEDRRTLSWKELVEDHMDGNLGTKRRLRDKCVADGLIEEVVDKSRVGERGGRPGKVIRITDAGRTFLSARQTGFSVG